MNILKDRIYPLCRKTTDNVINHLALDDHQFSENIRYRVEQEVWGVVTSCIDIRQLPETCGRSFWVAISHPGETQKCIALMLSTYSGRKNTLSREITKESVKKHIHDAMVNIVGCVKRRVLEVNWEQLLERTLSETQGSDDSIR